MLSAAEIYKMSAPFVARLVVHKMINGQFVTIGTGSGFLAGGHLVTCGHNIREIPGQGMTALYPQASWISEGIAGSNYNDPVSEVLAHSSEDSYDYAVLRALDAKVGLNFSERSPEVGEPVCSLGFAFDGDSLNIHQGIISSIGKSGVADMITLDMSVNPGNSGGPLISMRDGKVIGIVVRKATGLDKAFDGLIGTMKQNIDVLKKVPGGVQIYGMGFHETIAALQAQLLSVSEQMKRSAMVGIGYAVDIHHLLEEEVFGKS